MNEVEKGHPTYRMNEIHNMLCNLNVAQYAKLSEDKCRRFKLNDRDVLFNRTNSYDFVGRTRVYYETGKALTFASHLARLMPDKTAIYPQYLTAFFSSTYGVVEIKRHARQ